MIDATKREEAIEWINGKRNFGEGLALLISTGYKPGVLRVLSKKGANAPEANTRLKYHMFEYLKSIDAKVEISDTDAELHVFNGEEVKTIETEMPKAILAAAAEVEIGKIQPSEQIGKLLKKYAKLYRQRSMYERMMSEVGELNDNESMEKRKKYSDEIENITDELERLYPYWQEYSTNAKEPTDAQLSSKESQSEEQTGDNDSTLATDYSQLSKEELQKIRKSIATKISRAQNMLDYQTESKGEKPNPLTDPIKITKYNAKIERLTVELNKVKMAIAKFG